MKYNLADAPQVPEALMYLNELVSKKVKVEIKEIKPRRSLNQNSYLHLLIGAFGAHFGYTLDEAKTLYKRRINADIYVYEKNGEKFLRSSADLDTAEMTKSIDRFREFSKEQGFPLPAAENQAELMSLENMVERASHYL